MPNLETLGLVLETVPQGETLVLEGARLHGDPPFVWTVAVPTR